MEENDKIMTRIRKAMNLSKDNANDNESQNAMLLAQRLMAKYGIDMSEVSNSEEETSNEMIDEAITEKGRTPNWKKLLAMVVANNFRCYSYTRTGFGKSRLFFLGMKGDVALAKEMFEFAISVLQNSVRKYLKEQKSVRDDYNPTGLRNDYISGFISGLESKFTEQVEELNLTPMLVKDDTLVDEFQSRSFRTKKSSSVKRSHDGNAYSSGHKKGKSLTKHQRIGG